MNVSTALEAANLAYRVSGGTPQVGTGPAMHVPDGFLSLPVSLALWALAIGFVGYGIWRLNRELDERKVPLMGVLAAAIFAGQMLNFAVAGGTSGHLMGAALATILLGPWASIVVMTAVVAIQALLFQDGGLMALGANLLNMAVVGSFVAHAINWIGRKLFAGQRWGVVVSGFAAGWFSIMASALAVALQLALSGTTPASLVIPTMGGIHALIGIGEGLLTAGALTFIAASRGDLLKGRAAKSRSQAGVIVGGLLIALLLAVISPLASSQPDGLEWVAEELGFLDTARNATYNVIPDYIFPGISNEFAATILAGLVGAGVVFGVAYLTGRSRRQSERAGEANASS
jgi:cobalt/nickel transport system permease protein